MRITVKHCTLDNPLGTQIYLTKNILRGRLFVLYTMVQNLCVIDSDFIPLIRAQKSDAKYSQ